MHDFFSPLLLTLSQKLIIYPKLIILLISSDGKQKPLLFVLHKEERKVELTQHKAVTRFCNLMLDICGRTSKRKGRENKKFQNSLKRTEQQPTFFPYVIYF